MQKLLIILFLLISLLIPATPIQSATMVSGRPCPGGVTSSCADTSCTGFLWCQNFETETTGYDNSETWSTTGTVDPAETTSPLRGTQSATLADSSTLYRNVTTDGEIYAFGRFSFSDATPTAQTILFKGMNASSDVGWVTIQTTGKLLCQNGTVSNTASGDALANDTTYYIWIRIKAATSAEATDGIVTAEVSTTRNRADIVSGYGCSVTTGNDDDTDITSIRYMNSAAGGAGVKIDQLLGRTTSIGDVCE
jgi:hypothetical protein